MAGPAEVAPVLHDLGLGQGKSDWLMKSLRLLALALVLSVATAYIPLSWPFLSVYSASTSHSPCPSLPRELH